MGRQPKSHKPASELVSMRSRALARGALTWARLDRGTERLRSTVAKTMSTLLTHALTVEEMQEIGLRLYEDRSRAYAALEELFPWEEEWFRQHLPKAPGRILLGGAGTGREARVLSSWGYEVDAFEPARRSYVELQKRAGPNLNARRGSYQDLAHDVLDHDVLDEAPTPLRDFATLRYDAFIFGWTSLTHVLAEADRKRALETAARLTDGPILASFWLLPSTAVPANRAVRLGTIAARTLRTRSATHADQIRFDSHAGFAYAFREGELERLASQVGRTLALDLEGGYPHATLLPALK